MNFKMLFFKPIVILQVVLMVFVQLNVLVTASDVSRDIWPCDSQIFCKPFAGILHTVQTLRIFEVKEFVNEYFLPVGTELVPYNISEWQENPAIINTIQNDEAKELVKGLHERWKHLSKEMSTDVDESKTTLIKLKHPFIVPGGRFREIYYWDSYWTIKGLLHSELYDMVDGMLHNFKEMIDRFGHIPNGNRIYYERRSQPPFYSLMVDQYIQKMSEMDPSKTRELYASFIESMDSEFQFWTTRFRNISKNGETYQLASYDVKVDGPRPESYNEDFILGSTIADESKRKEWYGHMASGAESGWDFSSRWYSEDLMMSVTNPLLSIVTGDIIPVDLNSILCRVAEIISQYYEALERLDKAKEYQTYSDSLKRAIRSILWHDSDNIWYDYNIKKDEQNRNFYPSNLSPLYTGCYNDSYINKPNMIKGMRDLGVFDFPGGLPTSLHNSTNFPQQWDLPNIWPPLVEMFVSSMEELNTPESRKLAKEMATKFVQNVISSAGENSVMYEKYNALEMGKPGGGGEYGVQEGFGWTNGVTMDLLSRYPDMVISSANKRCNQIALTWTVMVSFILMYVF